MINKSQIFQIKKITLHFLSAIIFAVIVGSFVYEATMFNFKLLKNSFWPYGGAVYAVPNEVLNIYLLSKNNNISNFSMSGALLSDPLLHQRTVEFLYPSRYDPKANDVFMLTGESFTRDCPVIATSGGVVLYGCASE
jgi:hypothetical protein